jgi:hypothetical protein
MYKKELGNLLVPQKFEVPQSDPWPQETRGTKLGLAVNAIRGRNQFLKSEPERRAWLGSMGFVWQVRVRPGTGNAQWEIVKSALTVYKKEHGNLLVKRSFVVPQGDPWPQETRGTKLGRAANAIRNQDQFLKSGSGPERRDWLDSMGFVW